MKPETPSQEVEYQRRNPAKCIEKAASQPHLSFEEERLGNNENSPQRNNPSEVIKASASVDPLDKEKYEITVEDRQSDFGRNGSQRKEEYRSEPSFGVRRNEVRSSKREQEQTQEAQNSTQNISVQKRIEEVQKKSEQDGIYTAKVSKESTENDKIRNSGQKADTSKRLEAAQFNSKENFSKNESRKDDLEHGIARLKIQGQGSGSDYDKTGQSSSNVDSGRGSAVYSSGRRPPPEDHDLVQGWNIHFLHFIFLFIEEELYLLLKIIFISKNSI